MWEISLRLPLNLEYLGNSAKNVRNCHGMVIITTPVGSLDSKFFMEIWY